MKIISSRDNRYIKDCIKLKMRKYRDITGLFVIEGKRMMEELIACPDLKIRHVFIEESVANDYDLEVFNSEVFLINSKLMAEISDTDNPQGILAVVEQPIWNKENLKKDASVLVLLDGITDPGNMGTIIRTSWVFNVDGVLLTSGCVDPYSHKVVRSTMGGILNIPIFRNITISDIEDLTAANFSLLGSTVNDAKKYYEYDFTIPTIIIIGSEGQGMSSSLAKRCHDLITIPINPNADSLNAGVACGIILSEVLRQRDD
ncbi:MAG TPA: RNA methyltransferase [Syntrophomonadaceae bacterium]|nr:RNA methyltransferase [Syntrophomonadaceae bacterium]